MPPVATDDIEQDTTTATDAQLRTISSLLAQVPVAQEKVAQAELALSNARAALLELTDVKLPEALGAAGYSAPSKMTISGMQVKFATFVSASITEENQPRAFEWLRSTGNGDLIKRDIKFTFPKGSAPFVKLFWTAYEKLKKAKGAKLQVGVADKESVHSGTLKAFIKAELAEGREVPRDLFSVHTGSHVDVKPADTAPAI